MDGWVNEREMRMNRGGWCEALLSIAWVTHADHFTSARTNEVISGRYLFSVFSLFDQHLSRLHAAYER